MRPSWGIVVTEVGESIRMAGSPKWRPLGLEAMSARRSPHRRPQVSNLDLLALVPISVTLRPDERVMAIPSRILLRPIDSRWFRQTESGPGGDELPNQPSRG